MIIMKWNDNQNEQLNPFEKENQEQKTQQLTVTVSWLIWHMRNHFKLDKYVINFVQNYVKHYRYFCGFLPVDCIIYLHSDITNN